jgi:hypothetical protein
MTDFNPYVGIEILSHDRSLHRGDQPVEMAKGSRFVRTSFGVIPQSTYFGDLIPLPIARETEQ